MTEQGLRKLSSADKFLMAGNLASIAGVALISIGSLLRMVQRKELPSTIFFGNISEEDKDQISGLYKGKRKFFID